MKKNNDITNSINYAKRIQDAILPPIALVNKHLKDNFILYRPKDIVAGDFYWFERKNNISFIAAADCTGHGVPGAMVSVVCSNALNRAVLEFGLTEPGHILDKTRELVLETFSKSNDSVKDGMDISLISIQDSVSDNEQITINWSGANNPLWFFKSGMLNEIKPHKQPIGVTENATCFPTHPLSLKKGDTLFLFTDGFADQFGGVSGKKYKGARFKELLVSINNQPIKKQYEMIDNVFIDWKGNLEQVDDICVIGIRL